MKVASWNVNSIRVRIEHVTDWLRAAQPDVLALQELKATAEQVPVDVLEACGYSATVAGQKGFNGVALLSRYPLHDVITELPGNERDEAARYIEAWVDAPEGRGVRVGCLYLPNGNPVESPKFPYKLDWMRHLHARAEQLLQLEEAVVLAGDFNVCPTDRDLADPASMRDDALCRPESRARFRSLLHLGYTDAYRGLHPDAEEVYTYWDYGRAFDDNRGLRIDHLLLSPRAADRLEACDVDLGPRARKRPSDHTPIWCQLA
jgi:exodeoxyribonuclease-3